MRSPLARRFDAVIIGGGHNGLVCAAYLAGAGPDGLRASSAAHVLGGAAVTEEFHPGFPQLDRELHGQPARIRKVIRDLRPRASTASTIVERPFSNFLPLAGRRRATSRSAADSPRRRPRSRSSRAATPTRCPAYYAMLERVADVLRDLLLATPPTPVGAAARRRGAARRVEGRRAASARSTSPAQRDVLDLFTKSAGDVLDRWFESRADQGGVRLRRRRRQLREPVHAGLGLRAAAPRLRRGERQARGSGATRSAAWARSRRRWRRSARARGVDAAHRRARSRG